MEIVRDKNKQLKAIIDFSRLDIMRGQIRDWTTEVIVQDWGIGYCTNCVVEAKDGREPYTEEDKEAIRKSTEHVSPIHPQGKPVKKNKLRIMQVKFLSTNLPIYPISEEEEQKFRDLMVKHSNRKRWETNKIGTEPEELTDEEKRFINTWEDEKESRQVAERKVMETPSFLCCKCANDYYNELLTCQDFIVGFKTKTKQLQEMRALIECYQ